MHIHTRYQLVNRAPRLDLGRGERRVHYLHVPKCGGTTLRYLLEGFAALRGLGCVNEARHRDAPPDLSAGQVVMGHRRPPDALRRADTCYLTLLRDPVRRLRSHVAMIARRTELPVRVVVKRLQWRDANWAVHMLSGAAHGGPEALDRAKRALESRVHLFGFQERFEEAVALILAMLEIDGAIYPAFQATPARQQVDARYDDQFAALAADDLQLHAFAQQLYAARFEPVIEPAALHRREPDRSYLSIRVNRDTGTVDVSEAVVGA